MKAVQVSEDATRARRNMIDSKKSSALKIDASAMALLFGIISTYKLRCVAFVVLYCILSIPNIQ
jgi:hypothetical protein